MNDRITRVQRRIGAWLVTRATAAHADDDGAFTTETAIITGVLAVLALAVGAVITTKATGWAENIPGVGGG
ncbi:MAG TPA: hypothetical protein VGO78_16325 [Acidimicrobiales bacterium]|nr:hypothetical protein [Acidimicrobiales bacterium]